jgi:hypothetical protein
MSPSRRQGELLLLVIVATCLVMPGRTARAEDLPVADAPEPVATALPQPPAPAPGERPETWDSPPPREQLELDGTLIPPGKGAVFVPSMTDPRLEPPWLVVRDGSILQTVAPGRRAILDPGIYEIRLGSGVMAERFRRRVLVKEGLTTVVPATWSAVVIQVVDERSTPFRGSYELLRLPERRNLGMGLGADVELGEEVRTWILEPGAYLLIRAGGSPQARRDFYSFRVLPGEQVNLSLVMSREDGSFLGAGQVEPVGSKSLLPKDWRIHLVLGADAEFNRRSDMVGFPSGNGFTLGGYFDFLAQYKPLKHYLYLRLKLEEKQIKVPSQPFQKDLDEVKLDALYVYRVLPWLGPYVRVGAATSLFPGTTYLDEATEVREVDANGAPIGSLGTHKGQYQLSPSLSPSELKAGAGLGFLVTGSYWFDANIRVGIGGRALYTRGLLTASAFTDTPRRLDVRRRGNAYQVGAEATFVGSLRITRWVLATTELDVLEPFSDWAHPIIDWDSNVGIRLASFVSVNYIFRLVDDRDRSDRLQTEHRVLLRFSWQIL